MADATLNEAAVAAALKQCAALVGLVKSVESSLADISDPERLAGIERILSAQETALAEMIEAVKMTGVSKAIGDLSKAVAAAASKMGQAPKIEVNVPQQKTPVVNNNISPTPITVEAIMPQGPAPIVNVTVPSNDKPRKWKVKLAATQSSPAREMTIEQI